MIKISYELICYGLSDIGLARKNNEDVWHHLPHHCFYALADGMGGHKAGEIAAREAVFHLCNLVEKNFHDSHGLEIEDLALVLCNLIENTNSHIHNLSKKKKDFQGMGTTLCTLFFHEAEALFSHVGDSRIYRYRKKDLELLTFDHSLNNAKKKKSKKFLQKNILTRAIGAYEIVSPEIGVVSLRQNDIYFMCSDGLTDYVSDKEISYILKQNLPLQKTTDFLIQAAKSRGGSDNITVVMIAVT